MANKSVDLLQKQKLNLQVELNNLLHSTSKDQDKINELKADILYIDKQIEKLVGKKEIDRQNEFKKEKLDARKINIDNYNNFKARFKKISPMIRSTDRMIRVVDKLYYTKSDIENEKAQELRLV